MEMQFYRRPMGFLSLDILLDRVDEIFHRTRAHIDVSVEMFFPQCLWKRVLEDADTRGMTPPQLIRFIVRDFYTVE